MEVEHVVRQQMRVQNQQKRYKEAIVQHEQVAVRHVEMENIQQRQRQQVVVIVQPEVIVQVERYHHVQIYEIDIHEVQLRVVRRQHVL